MAKDCSFDVVSEVDMQEIDNAINQALREVAQRYDFKNSKASMTLDKQANEIKMSAEDDYKLGAMLDILRVKMVKRNVSLKCLKPGKIENAASSTVRQTVSIQQGLNTDKAKEIVKSIKDTKLKVQAQIQENQVRVSGAKKDDLQKVIQHLKSLDLEIDLQFINLRG